MIKGDYHIHTPFCPHGSSDDWELYIKQAIAQGLKEVSFTEHAPLPPSFTDPVPEQDSAMKWSDLPVYFEHGEVLKEKYQAQIKINIGFEVDYIEGYEDETKAFLNRYGEQIDDAILSVHMLKISNKDYACLDYSSKEFGRIIDRLGSVESVYHTYYETVKKAVMADLGVYKPTRIGHLSLVEKFQLKYPSQFNNDDLIDEILDLIKAQNYSLDLNTAGLHKALCKSIYPNNQIVRKAMRSGIPLIPGSDSHEASTVGRDFLKIKEYLKKSRS